MPAMRRNLTEELIEGATDGALKKGLPNRSAVDHNDTKPARELLSSVEGGFDWGDAGDHRKRQYTTGYIRGA